MKGTMFINTGFNFGCIKKETYACGGPNPFPPCDGSIPPQ